MPSSAKHCGDCLFASLSMGDETDIFLEERYVEGHILAIDGAENAAPIDMSQGDLVSDRIVAARGCAKMVRENKCARFIGLVVHGGDNAAKTFIMERDDFREQ
jgi:hypothetical protein